MLKITAEEIHFIIYQYLLESGKCSFLWPRHQLDRIGHPKTWKFCFLLIRSDWPARTICYCLCTNSNFCGRLWAFLICFCPRSQHARKPVQRVSHPQRHAHCFPWEGPHAHPYGNASRRCKYSFHPSQQLLSRALCLNNQFEFPLQSLLSCSVGHQTAKYINEASPLIWSFNLTACCLLLYRTKRSKNAASPTPSWHPIPATSLLNSAQCKTKTAET